MGSTPPSAGVTPAPSEKREMLRTTFRSQGLSCVIPSCVILERSEESRILSLCHSERSEESRLLLRLPGPWGEADAGQHFRIQKVRRHRQSRRKVVLHPNPPPTLEEGI